MVKSTMTFIEYGLRLEVTRGHGEGDLYDLQRGCYVGRFQRMGDFVGYCPGDGRPCPVNIYRVARTMV